MLRVTLAELESRMSELVNIRSARLQRAHAEIAEANRQFDEHAIPLGKQINELRAELKPAAAPKPHHKYPPKHPVLDGLTPEEQDHYRELLARKG